MTMISREQLYELVWSLPMSKAATQFEVSGSYLARVCAMLRVPRPERGYWAKLAVGKAPVKPPLPAIRFGDPFEWSKGDVIALVSAKPVASVPVMDEGIFLPSDMEKKRVRSVRREPVTGTHGLIQGARGHFENSRKVEEQQHLRPLKCLLVDVTASKGGLLKALSFANDLFNALETEGHRVTLASAGSRFIRSEIVAQEEGPPSTHYLDQLWSPMRPTITYIDEVGIGLAVVEMTEKVTMRYVDGRYIRDSEYVAPQRRWAASHTWTTEMNVPSGRMRLVAYAPYRGANEHQERCKTRWMEWKTPLELGIYFLKEEGLEFDRTYEERLVSLRNAERRTQLRSRFDFVLAQRAADLRSDPDGEAVLLEQHRKLIGDIQRLRDDIETDEERREKDKSQLDTLRSLAARIDRAVNSIMSQWRKAQDLRERVPLFEQSSSVEDSIYLRAARQQVDDIGDLDPSLSGDEMLVSLLEDLASNVQELPLAQRETELTGLKRQLGRNETELRSACKASLESKEADFSEAERSALDPINEIQLVARAVVDVYRSVELHLLGAQRLYSQSLEDAAAAEQRMIATITEFTTRLQDNFDELKRVLSRRGSTNEATLTISGTLVDETEIKGQVDFLVKTVDTEERHRREKQEQKSNVESDDAFSDRLKDTIRNGFYRAVFRAPADGKSSGPTIVFQHPEIADGRPIRLTREFSTGQANALALFILTKMADFALHRDSMHESTGFESRSRLKPSTTRVVIIDGLFSNLSNKQMIRNSLSAVRSLKGSFQLIGWIHRDDYENDPELFPTCIGLRRVRPNRGFVLAEDRNDVSEDLAPLFAHGEIKPLEIHMDTIPSA